AGLFPGPYGRRRGRSAGRTFPISLSGQSGARGGDLWRADGRFAGPCALAPGAALGRYAQPGARRRGAGADAAGAMGRAGLAANTGPAADDAGARFALHLLLSPGMGVAALGPDPGSDRLPLPDPGAGPRRAARPIARPRRTDPDAALSDQSALPVQHPERHPLAGARWPQRAGREDADAAFRVPALLVGPPAHRARQSRRRARGAAQISRDRADAVWRQASRALRGRAWAGIGP